MRAVAVDAAGKEHASGEQVVAYQHVHERRLIRPAAARVLALEVAVPAGLSVGYVDGAGDEVDSAIRQLGVPITYLGPDDLAFGDLSRFTTIVTGVRAYETRPDLRSYHDRLMRYVEEGGNLVVQYNRTDFNRAGDAAPAAPAPEGTVVDSPFAPYPGLRQPMPASPTRRRPRRSCARITRCWRRPTASAPRTGRAGCRSAASISWTRATRATWTWWRSPTPFP